MRKFLGFYAIVLGLLGVLISLGAIGGGWWAASQINNRLTQTVNRADTRMAELDGNLADLELRLGQLRMDLDGMQVSAARVAKDNPELPQVKASIEKLLDRLEPTLEHYEDLTNSLRSISMSLQLMADLFADFDRNDRVVSRLRSTADKIDEVLARLEKPRAMLEKAKSAGAVRLTQDLVFLIRVSAAGSEQLRQAIVTSRDHLSDIRQQATETRDTATFWIRCAAAGNTVLWVWGGLGQVCMIGWGRRPFRSPPLAVSP